MSKCGSNLPWAAPLLVAVCGFGWGIWEYRNNVNIQRVQATLQFHEAYRKEMSDVRLTESSSESTLEVLQEEIDQIRCGVLEIQEINCDAMTEEDVEKVRSEPLDSVQRAEVRRALNHLRVERINLDDDAVSDYYAFFNSIRVCILAKNCDLMTALALFAKDITNYLNEICVYVGNPNSYIGMKETKALARFLLDNDVGEDILWSDDEGRESLFLCDYLREL